MFQYEKPLTQNTMPMILLRVVYNAGPRKIKKKGPSRTPRKKNRIIEVQGKTCSLEGIKEHP